MIRDTPSAPEAAEIGTATASPVVAHRSLWRRIAGRIQAASPSHIGARKPAPLEHTISNHNNNYNSIRFILAASVIFYHSFGLTGAKGYIDYLDAYTLRTGLSLGGLAVDCFFFLSGLFVMASFYKDQSPVAFIIRRFCRVWPGLFVCLAVTACIACLISKPGSALAYLVDPSFYQYVVRNSYLSLVWQIPGVFENRAYGSINGSIHTLPTEVKAYLILLCLGAAGVLRRKPMVFASGTLLLLAVTTCFPFFTQYLTMPDYAMAPLGMFFAGMMLFAAAPYVRIRWWYILLCAAPIVLVPRPWNAAPALAAAATLMMAVGQMKHGWRPKYDISYGVYIYGWPSQQFVLTFFPNLNPYLLFGSALLLACAFATASWRIVEKPAIEFGHGLVATWLHFRVTKRFHNAFATLRSIPTLQRFSAVCLIFTLCAGMQLVAPHIETVSITALPTRITSYGPTHTRVGEGFNVQPSGDCGIWVAFDRKPPFGTHLLIDGRPLETQIRSDSVTAAVPRAVFSVPGDKVVALEFLGPGIHQRSNSVVLRVTP